LTSAWGQQKQCDRRHEGHDLGPTNLKLNLLYIDE